MNPLTRIGLTPPSEADLISGAVALLFLALALGAGWFVGRRAGPRLARWWTARAGGRSEGIADRMCVLARYATAALLLAIVLAVDDWRALGALILGLGLAATAALLATGLVRGLHMPRWTALLLGGAVFVTLLARAVGGLQPVLDTLDRIGFAVAGTRYTLLALVKILLALLILFAVVRLVNRVASHSIRKTARLDPTQQLLAQKLVGVALLAAAFFIGIDIVGIDLTALAVFSGAFGLAIGFGLQKTFGNLIAGIILLMDRSVKPGDVIVVGDSFGHVSKIGVRAVSIVTRDGKEHLIPNENLMTQEVENWSYSSPNVRVHIPVGVGYGSDLPLAQRLMVEAAVTPDRVLKSPQPTVWLRAFGESSVDHEILVWIADPEAGVGNVQSEILNRLWVLFKENDIELPYPQRDIHLKDWPVPPSGQ